MLQNITEEEKEGIVDVTRLLYDPSYRKAFYAFVDSRRNTDFVHIPATNVQKSRHVFITINPSPDVQFKSFIDKVHKVQYWKWIKSIKYVFEQRGETEIKGLHCHLLIDRGDKSVSHLKDQFYRSFKAMVGSPKSIDVREVRTQDDYDRTLNYMSGHKEDKKMAKVQLDNVMREQYNLKPIY